jgi:hypothetical protein
MTKRVGLICYHDAFAKARAKSVGLICYDTLAEAGARKVRLGWHFKSNWIQSPTNTDLNLNSLFLHVMSTNHWWIYLYEPEEIAIGSRELRVEASGSMLVKAWAQHCDFICF